jgi:hypothetical protein
VLEFTSLALQNLKVSRASIRVFSHYFSSFIGPLTLNDHIVYYYLKGSYFTTHPIVSSIKYDYSQI